MARTSCNPARAAEGTICGLPVARLLAGCPPQGTMRRCVDASPSKPSGLPQSNQPPSLPVSAQRQCDGCLKAGLEPIQS